MYNLLDGLKDMFLGLQPNAWRKYRRRTYRADYSEILDDLHAGEAALTSALSAGSWGTSKLDIKDRVALIELIDQVRNYIFHIDYEYITGE